MFSSHHKSSRMPGPGNAGAGNVIEKQYINLALKVSLTVLEGRCVNTCLLPCVLDGIRSDAPGTRDAAERGWSALWSREWEDGDIGKRFPREITDEQDVEGGLGSSQGPKEKWTCWLRAEPPAKAVCAEQTSLPGNPSGRPWQGLGGSVVLSCWPRPGFIECTYVPLQESPLPPVAGFSLYLCVWFYFTLCQQRPSYWSEVSKKGESVNTKRLLVWQGSGTGSTGLSVSKPGGHGSIPWQKWGLSVLAVHQRLPCLCLTHACHGKQWIICVE